MPSYSYAQIALELRQTAAGQAYHGNALHAAKDIPEIVASPPHLIAITRYLSGRQTEEDRFRLQEAAAILEKAAPRHGGPRSAGPGKKMGRPRKPASSLAVSTSITLSSREALRTLKGLARKARKAPGAFIEAELGLNQPDIGSVLKWDVSHVIRTLRGSPKPILRATLKAETARPRPRKRLVKWLQSELAGDDIQHILAEYKAACKAAPQQYEQLLSEIMLKYFPGSTPPTCPPHTASRNAPAGAGSPQTPVRRPS